MMSPPAATGAARPLISVVVIGRNEGERLSRCLASVAAMRRRRFDVEVLYVDSASTDDSVKRAADAGARVIEVRPERPCAAVGRNAGWHAARGEFVLFLDGDTILHPRFVARALEAMRDPATAVVWGHRRELHPDRSIYNRVLDLDWIYPPGPSEFSGGDALMRRSALAAVGGFDASLIAGEEPELCRRIRAQGGIIQHIDAPMTGHDLAIMRFSAYWKRAYRAGHAYAEVAGRFRHSPDPLWLRDSRRNMIHAGLLLASLAALPFSLRWPPLFPAVLAFLLLLVARTWLRSRWKSDDSTTRLLYSLHSHFQQIPILAGQFGYYCGALTGRRRPLIEYKGNPTAVRQTR